MPVSVAWFFTWIVATAAFLSIPAIAMFARAYRVARRNGVRKPALFVTSRATSWLFRRRDAIPTDVPHGRVFVEWDVRWLSAGGAVALAQPEETAVTLVFESSQDIGEPSTTFLFQPEFRRGSAVHGVIVGAGAVDASAVVHSLGV